MPILHLTDLTIQSLKPTGQQVLFYCDQTPNFGVRVNQRGTKTFFVNLGKARDRLSLGRYPTVSLQDARRRARQLLLTLHMPLTPAQAMTLSEAFSTYRTSYVAPNYKPRSASVTVRLFRHLKHLEHQPLKTITVQQINGILDGLSATPSEANHFLSALRTFMNWCKTRQYIELSPVAGTPKPYRETPRSRVLEPTELVAIWKACRGDTFGRLVKCCILSAQRRGEFCNLLWKDCTPQTITFRDTKNRSDHCIPNTPRLRAVIESQPRTNDLVFPCKTRNSPYNDFNEPKKQLDKRSGVTGYVLHDFRRTAASMLAAPPISAAPHHIEKLLNHAAPASLGGQIGTTYNRHAYLDEIRAALIKYHVHLNHLLAES